MTSIPDKTGLDREINQLLKELKEDPFRTFYIAFTFAGLIPLAMLIYFLIDQTLIRPVLLGRNGIILFSAVIFSMAGYYIGYVMIRKILAKIIAYAILTRRKDHLKASAIVAVSHELGNPLATMKISLSNMMEGLIGKLTEEQKKIISSCYSVTDRMTGITRSLLDLFKIEAGVADFDRSVCDVRGIVDSQIDEFAGAINGKKMELKKDYQGKDITVWADKGKITRVVNNLLSNAVKYTPDGGSISVALHNDTDNVLIMVSDTGPGVPPDKQKYIFDKFTRFDTTKEGAGVGLAISRDIVEAHKGRIWMSNNMAGGGCTFHVSLPRNLRRAAGSRNTPDKT